MNATWRAFGRPCSQLLRLDGRPGRNSGASVEQEKFNVNNSLAQVYIARGATGDYERAIVAETEAGKSDECV